ncbi:MAG TPA: O-antigen ligase domain-containing protein, partial [Methylovirgula sp.]
IFGIWDMAHSTPLQVATEMGLPVAFLVAAAWAAALVILARGVRIRQRDVILPFSGAMVALIGLAHSSVDFSLQIPGYSIVAMGIVGMGLAQSFRTVSAD